MRPLNVVINDEVVDNEVKNQNTEPGVHSDLNIHRSVLINYDKNILTKSDIILNKNKGKYRSVSDSRAPQIEELFKLDKSHSSSSHLTLVVPPMAKKDIFYSGSTANLKWDSNENFESVSSSKHINNNNTNKRSNKTLTNSDPHQHYENPNNSNLRISVKGEENQSCAVVREIFDLSVLRKPAMALLSISNIFGMTGYYIPFVYITQHVRKSIKGMVFISIY